MSNIVKADKQYEIDYIDASGSSTFSRCPAMYFFERVLGLVNKDRDMTAPDYGTDFHVIAPLCYGAMSRDEEQQLFENAFSTFEKLRNKRTVPDTDKKHSLEHSEPRIRNFIELHAKNVCPYKIVKFPFTVPEGAEVISDNEIPFIIDIGGPLLFAGRIDFPAELKQTGELFAGDYKTTSEISGRLWECFELNAQAIGYTLGLSHISGKQVTGFLVEAIRKSVQVSKVECAIHYIYVTPYEVEFFIGYMNDLANEIMHYNDFKRWPKKLSGCSVYPTTGIPGGNCPYKLLCKAKDWRDVAPYYDQVKPFHPFRLGVNKDEQGDK